MSFSMCAYWLTHFRKTIIAGNKREGTVHFMFTKSACHALSPQKKIDENYKSTKALKKN